MASWERKADPEGVLSPEERSRRAESLRKAHMSKMAFLSAKARRRRAARKTGGDSDAA